MLNDLLYWGSGVLFLTVVLIALLRRQVKVVEVSEDISIKNDRNRNASSKDRIPVEIKESNKDREDATGKHQPLPAPPAPLSARKASSIPLVKPETHGSRVFRDRKESNLILEAAYGLTPQISAAAGSLVDLAIRDFVYSWYRNTSPDPEFLEDIRLLLLDIVGGFLIRLCKLNFVVFLLKDVAPILRRNFKNFHAFRKSAAQKNPELFKRTGNETVVTFQEREKAVLEAGFILHKGARDDGSHAQLVVMRVLRAVLAPSDSSCHALTHLIREIIVRNIVLPILESLHPYCINIGLASSANKAVDSSPLDSKPNATGSVDFSDGSSTLDEDASIVQEKLESVSAILTTEINVEEEHFKNNHAERPSPTIESDTDFRLISLKVGNPDLFLDYAIASDPAPFMSYCVEVRAELNKTKKIINWSERTRYSELKLLHEKLLRKHPTLTAAFPKSRGWKKYVFAMSDYEKDFVEERTNELNMYMNSLASDPYVQDSRILKRFLCHTHKLSDLVAASANSNTEDTASSASASIDTHSLFSGTGVGDASFARDHLDEMYSLIDEIFLLDHARFSFFRSNIISFVRVIVRTAFGGSLFSYLKSISDQKADAIAQIVLSIRNGTWPDGQLAPPPAIPPVQEQTEAMKQSILFLKSALPRQVVSLIGASHRDYVAESCHEMIQYHLLSKSVCLETADALIKKLFPEEE